MQPRQDLIYDLGVSRGEDTWFYLEKGFHVVGVEADPLLHASVTTLFSQYINDGQLTLLNVGIWNERRDLMFYRNLDNDHWSSFDPDHGCRHGSRCEPLPIPCVRIEDLLLTYGVPYYIKIDVEGADRLVLADLARLDVKPRFLSCEQYGLQLFDDLKAIGYQKFKIMPQNDKSWAVPPRPPLEGTFVARRSSPTDSGLFGLELPGEWLSYAEAYAQFRQSVRNETWEYVGVDHEWYDIHATY